MLYIQDYLNKLWKFKLSSLGSGPANESNANEMCKARSDTQNIQVQ